MRSLLSGLSALVGALFIFVLVPLLVIGVAAAILLGIGSLLTRLFPVTVFEATLIVTLAAFPLAWLYSRLLNQAGLLGPEVEAEEVEEEPEPPHTFERMIMVPPRPARGRRKKNQ
jgi:hypothetical protein